MALGGSLGWGLAQGAQWDWGIQELEGGGHCMGSLVALRGIHGLDKGSPVALEGHGMRSPMALEESTGTGCSPQ